MSTKKKVHYNDQKESDDDLTVALVNWNAIAKLEWGRLKQLAYTLDATTTIFSKALEEIRKTVKGSGTKKEMVESVINSIAQALDTKEAIKQIEFDIGLPQGLEESEKLELLNCQKLVTELRKTIATMTESGKRYLMNDDNYHLAFDTTVIDTRDKFDQSMYANQLPTYKDINRQLNSMSILNTVGEPEPVLITPELKTIPREIETRRHSTEQRKDTTESGITGQKVPETQCPRTPIAPDWMRTNNLNFNAPRVNNDYSSPKKLEPSIIKFKGHLNEDVEDWIFSINRRKLHPR